VTDVGEVLTVYGTVGPDSWSAYVLPILRELPRALLAAVAGISERAVANLWNERSKPSRPVQAALTQFAADHTRATRALEITDDMVACMSAVLAEP